MKAKELEKFQARWIEGEGILWGLNVIWVWIGLFLTWEGSVERDWLQGFQDRVVPGAGLLEDCWMIRLGEGVSFVLECQLNEGADSVCLCGYD